VPEKAVGAVYVVGLDRDAAGTRGGKQFVNEPDALDLGLVECDTSKYATAGGSRVRR